MRPTVTAVSPACERAAQSLPVPVAVDHPPGEHRRLPSVAHPEPTAPDHGSVVVAQDAEIAGLRIQEGAESVPVARSEVAVGVAVEDGEAGRMVCGEAGAVEHGNVPSGRKPTMSS